MVAVIVPSLGPIPLPENPEVEPPEKPVPPKPYVADEATEKSWWKRRFSTLLPLGLKGGEKTLS